MIGWQVKAALALLGAAALGFAGWKINDWRIDANKLEAAEKEFAATVKSMADAAQTNREISADLAAFRSEQAQSTASFRDELAKRNITREIRYVTKEGAEAVCVQRDPARYRELFNQAVTGTPGP